MRCATRSSQAKKQVAEDVYQGRLSQSQSAARLTPEPRSCGVIGHKLGNRIRENTQRNASGVNASEHTSCTRNETELCSASHPTTTRIYERSMPGRQRVSECV